MSDPGKESSLTVDGKTWKVSRPGITVIYAFRDWIRDQIGDPFGDLDRFIDKLDKADAIVMFKEGQATQHQLAIFSLQTPIAMKFLQTETGAAKFLQLLLSEHHPDMTVPQAFELMMRAGKEKLAELFEKLQGKKLSTDNNS